MKTLLEALRTQRQCACACHALLPVEERTRGVEALYACDDMLRGYGYEPDYEVHGDAIFRAAQKARDPSNRRIAVRFGECMQKRLVGSMLHELLHAAFGEPPKANYGIPWGLPYSVPADVPAREEEAYLARFNEAEARAFVGVLVMAKARFGIEWTPRTARDVGTYGFPNGNAMVPSPKGFRPIAHLDRKHHEARYYARARKIEDDARAWFASEQNVADLLDRWREREELGRASRREKLQPASDFGRMAPKKTLTKDPCICGSQLPYGECCMRLGASALDPLLAR